MFCVYVKLTFKLRDVMIDIESSPAYYDAQVAKEKKEDQGISGQKRTCCTVTG